MSNRNENKEQKRGKEEGTKRVMERDIRRPKTRILLKTPSGRQVRICEKNQLPLARTCGTVAAGEAWAYLSSCP